MKDDVNTQIMECFFQISRSLKGKMTYNTEIANLSLLQLYTLMFIKRSDRDIHMKDIAEYFAIELPTATSLLNKLDKLGLVARVIDREDRRNITVTLTTNGKKILAEAEKMHEKKLKKMLSYLSGGQKTSLLSILKTLSQQI
ncbi:MAG TPA: MarR family transcriptional regulator [Patescibacteria group bacterium]|nr:MarR family transcriptional regulator [Patescibacteria group bacterium]